MKKKVITTCILGLIAVPAIKIAYDAIKRFFLNRNNDDEEDDSEWDDEYLDYLFDDEE